MISALETYGGLAERTAMHHSFALGFVRISRALSLSTLLNSLPLGFFGTATINSTPPASFFVANFIISNVLHNRCLDLVRGLRAFFDTFGGFRAENDERQW